MVSEDIVVTEGNRLASRALGPDEKPEREGKGGRVQQRGIGGNTKYWAAFNARAYGDEQGYPGGKSRVRKVFAPLHSNGYHLRPHPTTFSNKSQILHNWNSKLNKQELRNKV
ncbi:hypothetical protein C7212DRAFT_341037 [Tuber magnatum]|uniref:Uncharacterized protein n=1 Tax=Tuber magnatum TaxID=42249 RepID=A0A317T578_9PEZI|nr:hypothetical protein C7212DRAFT_341037 [Tuber magnatum]